MAICSVRASRVMHLKMLKNILRAPMSFFETTPAGRILNRFSRDVETIDNILPSLARSWVNTTFTVVSTVVVISYSTPIFLVMILPLALLYFFIQVGRCFSFIFCAQSALIITCLIITCLIITQSNMASKMTSPLVKTVATYSNPAFPMLKLIKCPIIYNSSNAEAQC